jgi:hypothetical protein
MRNQSPAVERKRSKAPARMASTIGPCSDPVAQQSSFKVAVRVPEKVARVKVTLTVRSPPVSIRYGEAMAMPMAATIACSMALASGTVLPKVAQGSGTVAGDLPEPSRLIRSTLMEDAMICTGTGTGSCLGVSDDEERSPSQSLPGVTRRVRISSSVADEIGTSSRAA